METGIIYRLKGGKTPLSYGLKQTEVGINKAGEGFKYINYYAGSDSIFVDDNPNRKVTRLTFEYNDLDATELIVPTGNITLNRYMQAHPHFNVHYEIYSEELSSDAKLADFDKKEKALLMIKETDKFKIQAIALAIIGMESFGWSPKKCMAVLKEKALTTPEVILTKVESTNYESKYLSALAFFSFIVKENNLQNAVVWNDENEGVILHLAKGENGIQKLGELLSFNTPESKLVIQEIGIRINRLTVKKNSANITPEGTVIDTEVMTVEEAQLAYNIKFGEEAPRSYKNNLAWLTKKLTE
jgi:hypothetical protein